MSFLVVLGLWLTLSLILWYQYLLFSSEKDSTRGWTFVEAIFDNVSYLPYWWTNANDSYYQSLFFDSCQKYMSGSYVSSLCDVTTEDNKTYIVSVATWSSWSDWVEVTADDVFFTYNDIIRNNSWQIPHLDVYDVISVNKKDDGTIKVTFPFVSVDNMNFFTQYILPEHVVKSMELEEYKTLFARNPVYGWCARIHESSQDEASLVFELSDCSFTNILFYQLKSFEGEDDFTEYLRNASSNIIGMYSNANEIAWYKNYKVLTDKYMTIFFNHESKHLNNSIRRSLWGLLEKAFYTGDYSNHIFKDHLIFDTFWSEWSNLEHHIINKNPRLDVNKDGLERININKISKKIYLSGGAVNQLVYYLDVMPESDKFAVYFRTEKKYDRIIISHEWTTWTQNLPYNKSIDRYQYNLELGNNITEGLNKYSVKGYNKDKIETIAEIDVYYLNLPAVDDESRQQYIKQKWKIKVIYFDDLASNYVVDKLHAIFDENNASQYFHFVSFSSTSEFDTKLMSKDYDVVISPFDFARKKDFSSFLLTDVPTINPSLYTNTQLASYISDYVHKSDAIRESLKAQINDIYANDMPFIILWQIITPHFVKDNYAVIPSGNVYTIEDFKNSLLENISVVQHARLRKEKVFSWAVMKDFVWSLFK